MNAEIRKVRNKVRAIVQDLKDQDKSKEKVVNCVGNHKTMSKLRQQICIQTLKNIAHT